MQICLGYVCHNVVFIVISAKMKNYYDVEDNDLKTNEKIEIEKGSEGGKKKNYQLHNDTIYLVC